MSSCRLGFELHREQEANVSRLLNILRKWYFCIDMSLMGRGKTRVACALSVLLQLPLLVVCTASTSSAWEGMRAFGVKIVQVLSYDALRGREGHVSHPWLARDPDFRVTEAWTALVERGVLLVFDEFHRSKNLSFQREACRTLLTAFRRGAHSPRSRVAFLSGTPYDKQEHVLHFLQLVGVAPEGSAQGALSAVSALARRVAPGPAAAILEKAKSAEDAVFGLFVGVLSPEWSACMKTEPSTVQLRVYAAFFELSPEDKSAHAEALGELSAAVRKHRAQATERDSKRSAGLAIQRPLHDLELAKATAVAAFACAQLRREPQCKFIMMASFLDTLQLWSRLLQGFVCELLTGAVSRKTRAELCERFQLADTQLRVLLVQLLVGAEGINLQDTHGDFPRYMCIMNTYDIRLQQATRRTHCLDSASDSHVFICHGPVSETPIMRALANKGSVLGAVLVQQVKDGVQFPGEFQEVRIPLQHHDKMDTTDTL